MSSLGVSRPQNAQEWKELVSLSVQTTMATAKSLRVLKRVLASLPVDEDDTDIAGMRAAQLAGAFGGLISELGVSANATATTLRGLLSLAVAAGAAARFAPWHVSPDGDSLSGTDRSPASTPQSSGRGNAKANRPGASGRRLTLDERLAAAQKKQQAGPLVPSFPETLSNPRPLPLGRVDTLEERPSWREPGSDRGSEDLSTPAKLRSGSPVGHRSNTHGEDAESEESSKDSPESAKARRARLQQMRSFSTPGLGDILKGRTRPRRPNLLARARTHLRRPRPTCDLPRRLHSRCRQMRILRRRSLHPRHISPVCSRWGQPRITESHSPRSSLSHRP